MLQHRHLHGRFVFAIFVAALFLVAASMVSCDRSLEKADCAKAFAEAYGLVRWYYPGDLPDGFDWNGFALYGMEKVSGCKDTDGLRETLDELFSAVAPGVVFSGSGRYKWLESVTPPDTSGMYCISWQHRGVDLGPRSNWYVSKKTGRAIDSDNASKLAVELSLMPGLPYDELKVTADIRNNTPESLKVYFKTAFNSGMDYYISVCSEGKEESRVAEDPGWQNYERTIDLRTAGADASPRIVLFTDGKGSFSIKNVTVHTPDGNIVFAPDELTGWSEYNGVYDYGIRNDTVTVSTNDYIFRQHSHFGDVEVREIAKNLYVHVPLALYGTDSTTYPAYDAVKAGELMKRMGQVQSYGPDVVMSADIAVAWNVARYFHPYLSDLGADWDAVLGKYLAEAVNSASYSPSLLRRMMAGLNDAHVSVACYDELEDARYLPFRARLIDDEVVVTHSFVSEVRRGDVIGSVNGVPASGRWKELEEEVSGGENYRRVAAEKLWLRSFSCDEARLSVNDGNGKRDVQIRLLPRNDFIKADADAEYGKASGWIASNVLYINTSRLDMAEIRNLLKDRKSGQSVIVDNRYGSSFVTLYLLNMLTDRFMLPQKSGTVSIPCSFRPVTPEIKDTAEDRFISEPDSTLVFLADASNISQFEDAYDYMRYIGAGIIVGSPTGGCTGRINVLSLPSGNEVTFTGVKVFSSLGPQGYFYGVGIRPDVFAEETLRDIRNGRDAVLEKALQTVTEIQE